MMRFNSPDAYCVKPWASTNKLLHQIIVAASLPRRGSFWDVRVATKLFDPVEKSLNALPVNQQENMKGPCLRRDVGPRLFARRPWLEWHCCHNLVGQEDISLVELVRKRVGLDAVGDLSSGQAEGDGRLRRRAWISLVSPPGKVPCSHHRPRFSRGRMLVIVDTDRVDHYDVVIVKPPIPDSGLPPASGGRRTVACRELCSGQTLSESPEDVAGCANPPAAAHRRFASCDDSETRRVRIEMDEITSLLWSV